MASAEKPVEKSAESAEDKASAMASDQATDKATVKPKKTHVYVHFIPGKDAQIAGTPWIIHTINGALRTTRVPLHRTSVYEAVDIKDEGGCRMCDYLPCAADDSLRWPCDARCCRVPPSGAGRI